MSTNPDTFFGAVDPRTLNALPIGALVEFTYDDLGARRESRYHTVRGVVRRVNESTDRGFGWVALEQVTRTRPGGVVTDRPADRLDFINIMAVTVLEGFAA